MKSSQFTQRQTMLNEGYEVYYYSTQENCDVELHHHDFYELYYFISGSVSYDIDCCSYVLAPGDIVLIAPGRLHKPVFLEDGNKYKRIVLWISKKLIEELSSSQTDLSLCFILACQEGQNRIPNNELITPKIKACLDNLLEIETNNAFGEDILSKVYIQYLLVALANYLSLNTNDVCQISKKDPILESALGYINDNLACDLRLDIIAAKLEINKYYLAHKFKRQLGVNIGRYITLKRLSLAKELLLRGQAVQDVGKACGYNNLSNFFRVFKIEFGLTPKEYYKMMQ